MTKDIGKVDVRKLEGVFLRKAQQHQGLMADAHKAGQMEVFQAHTEIASGYYRASHLLARAIRKLDKERA